MNVQHHGHEHNTKFFYPPHYRELATHANDTQRLARQCEIFHPHLHETILTTYNTYTYAIPPSHPPPLWFTRLRDGVIVDAC